MHQHIYIYICVSKFIAIYTEKLLLVNGALNSSGEVQKENI